MMGSFNPYYESVKILKDNEPVSGKSYHELQAIMEDTTSPVTRSYQEKLYQSVIDRGHIDFGSIPKSRGNIKDYDGYETMVETLETIKKLGLTARSNEVVTYATKIMEAINNIASLSNVYMKGFSTKCDYVIIEYNTFVYTCVEATTSLLYEFVDYMKRPDQKTYEIVLKDTKGRANLFYYTQLVGYNNVIKNMGPNYRKFLESMILKGQQNFMGTEALVGTAAISMVALAIIPITRKLIWLYWRMRGDISRSLEYQAKFLEMNRTCVEANNEFTEEKKAMILKKQESQRQVLLRIADALKIKDEKAIKEADRDLAKDNKSMKVSDIKSDISNSPFELI